MRPHGISLRSLYIDQLLRLRAESPGEVRRHKRQVTRIWMLGSQ